MFKNIVIGIGIAAAIFTVLVFSGKTSFGNSSSSASATGQVTIWGTIPESQVDSFLQTYNPAVKTYTVIYKEVKEDRFVLKLVDAIASGSGPDLIIAPYQMIISQVSKIKPFPITAMTEKSYKDVFVNGTSVFWTPYGAMALPVSIEPLMLFYNRTLLAKNGIVNPPMYWGDVINMVPKLTSVDRNGKFNEVAIPMGTFDNIPNAKEIIMNLVYQLNQTPVTITWTDKGPFYNVTVDDAIDQKGEVKPLTSAVRFWTEFANQSKPAIYTWNNFMPDPKQLFLGEKLAMYIGFSSDYDQIRQGNQKIDFGMASIPQNKDANTFSTGMKLYGIATLNSTKNPNTSFTVESSFAGAYSKNVAGFIGGVSPIKANIVNNNLDDDLVKSVINARGFYDVYYDQTTNLFSQMINNILNGRLLVVDSVTDFTAKFSRLYNGN